MTTAESIRARAADLGFPTVTWNAIAVSGEASWDHALRRSLPRELSELALQLDEAEARHRLHHADDAATERREQRRLRADRDVHAAEQRAAAEAARQAQLGAAEVARRFDDGLE